VLRYSCDADGLYLVIDTLPKRKVVVIGDVVNMMYCEAATKYTGETGSLLARGEMIV
jgi:hypothetical protein